MSEDRIFAKCAWRLLPFAAVLYLLNNIDRVNVGFAALTMNRDLGFSPSVYGFAAGLLYLSYAGFQVPASLAIAQIGARRGIFCVLFVWGIISAANALVRNPASFYVLRFLLGFAEAGFFPAMVIYLTRWFPRASLGRSLALFQMASPLAFVVAGPLSGLILGLDGSLSLRGWQWLFLAEGLPACVCAFAALRLLPAGPAEARWLGPQEASTLQARIEAEGAGRRDHLGEALRDWRVFALGLAAAANLVCMIGIQLWLPLVVQAMGFPVTTVGLLVALVFVLAAGGMALWGYSSDLREDRIWHIAIAGLAAAGGMSLAAASHSNFVVLAALTIAAIASNSAVPLFNCLTAGLLRGRAAAGGFALYNMIANLGGIIGPLVIGSTKQATGGFPAGFLVLALSEAVCVAIVLSLNRSVTRMTILSNALEESA